MHASADHRIVVLHGKESFLRSEHTRRVLDALRERFGAVDEFSFDGASCSLADVLDELRSYGLMSQHKVVVVDNAEQFMQGDDRRRAMERYAESPMPDATLILRSAGWRPGTFDKLVAAVGVILKCEAPGAAEAVRWAVARSQKRHGVELSAAGAQALVERVGPDLGRLDSELGKLAVGALSERIVFTVTVFPITVTLFPPSPPPSCGWGWRTCGSPHPDGGWCSHCCWA